MNSNGIIQRKVLTPNDFPDLDAVRMRLAFYEDLSNQHPKPFAWKFTRDKLADLLKRIAARAIARWLPCHPKAGCGLTLTLFLKLTTKVGRTSTS